MDLICSFHSGWEGFGSSSLATLPLVSVVVLYPPLHVGRALGLPLRLLWRTGFAPVRARGEGGATAWVAGVLAAPGTQGSWWIGQQEL